MRIERIDIFAKRYTLSDGPFVMSGGKIAHEQDATIVRLVTDSGEIGWGEQCAFSANYIAAHGEGARAALGLLAPAVIGLDPRQPQRVYDAMNQALKGHAYAKSALDMACWDVLGRATGLRLSDLLGGTYAEQLPLYTGIGVAPPEAMREQCLAALEQGYRRFQLKVGSDWKTDIARVQACVEVLQDAEKVIVDANGYWGRQEARRVVAAIEDLDVFIEQPCATLDQCAAIAASSSRPFILDESLACVEDLLRGVQSGALDAAMMKLSRFGGVSAIRPARDLCTALGLAMTIEDSGGGDIVSAAMAHLAASVRPDLLMNGFLVGRMVKERLATDWSPLQGAGVGMLPTGPGLGITVDAAALGDACLSVP